MRVALKTEFAPAKLSPRKQPGDRSHNRQRNGLLRIHVGNIRAKTVRATDFRRIPNLNRNPVLNHNHRDLCKTGVAAPRQRAASIISMENAAVCRPPHFLVELGLMNASGKIVSQKYDKFRQINKFLEMVEDVLSSFEEGKQIHVVDFGCGKAYLTFALYYYLREVRGMDISLTGVDLKEDVIAYCQGVAERLGYTHLHFRLGTLQAIGH